MSLTLEKGGEMDVLVGIHIYIHMQETLALASCGVGEQTVCLCPCSVRACVRACARSILSPLPLLPPSLLLLVVVQEVCEPDERLEDEPSGRT